MKRIVVSLLLVSAVAGMKQENRWPFPLPDYPFPVLPIYNVCPPCQPSSCYCGGGKELTQDDRLDLEQVSFGNGEVFYNPHRLKLTKLLK